MSVDEKVELNETCDSCGCFAEIGTIIGEGDDVMELVIEAAAEADAVILKARLQFTCTAEKLIFEMRARSI